MTEEDPKTNSEALADLYEAAALKTAEPIKFDTDETADSETEN